MLFILISYLILIILNRNIVIATTKDSFTLWFNYIFCSLYLILIVSDLIIRNKYLKNKGIYVIYLLSFILGNPSIAKLLSRYNINKNKKAIIIATTSFFNPLFLLSIFSDFGTRFFISYYISNIFLLIILFINVKEEYIPNSENVFISVFKILISILGVMIFSSVIFNIIKIKHDYKILDYIHPLIEITSGLFKVKNNPYLSLIVLNFCGISIHIQNKLICDYNYLIYLVIRILALLISVFIYKFYIYSIFILSILFICCIILRKKLYWKC